jgi:arylformamidase
MKIYDITLPVKPGMLVWPGDPPVTLRQVSSIQKGDQSNVSQLRLSVHTGTHIDAAKHFLDNGKTVDQVSLSKLIGSALVIQIDEQIDVITDQVLKNHPRNSEIGKYSKILFRTRNSSQLKSFPNTFNKAYVGIDTSGAEYLAGFPLDLIGVDYLSVAPFWDTEAPHKVLLSRDIILLEGIDLSTVPEGIYQIFCLPINLVGSEGAPARVILTHE